MGTPAIGGVSGGGGGVSDHPSLTDRNLADQHTIAAVTSLQGILDTKLTSVAVDGLTVSGNGVVGNPLVVEDSPLFGSNPTSAVHPSFTTQSISSQPGGNTSFADFTFVDSTSGAITITFESSGPPSNLGTGIRRFTVILTSIVTPNPVTINIDGEAFSYVMRSIGETMTFGEDGSGFTVLGGLKYKIMKNYTANINPVTDLIHTNTTVDTSVITVAVFTDALHEDGREFFSAVKGDEFLIIDTGDNASVNNITIQIGAGFSTINGSASDYVINVDSGWVKLLMVNDTPTRDFMVIGSG